MPFTAVCISENVGRLWHTDDITVKQAVEYILAQPDGEWQFGTHPVDCMLTLW